MKKLHYYKIYKPFQVLSQFSKEEGKKTLMDYFDVPKDVYPVGRLDYDSEGLLILTNDTSLNQKLLLPRNAHERTYWVQVEGLIDNSAVGMLENGVIIAVDGKPYPTLPSKASILETVPNLPERNPPIRFRKNIPDSWLSLTLVEGKNRQVRKMTAAVGFPTLRLVRFSIGGITIEGLLPGEMEVIPQASLGLF